MTQITNRRGGAKPAVVLDADHVDHLTALADGVAARDPALSDALLDELERAKVVKAAKMPADVVTLGNRVRYRDEKTGAEHEVTLVYPEAADISFGRVSVVTPIGVALLGLRQGARFSWKTRTNEIRTLRILEVLPAETAGSAG